MKGFLDKDIERLAALWKGEVTFIEKEDRVTTMNVKKRYIVGDGDKNIIIDRVLQSGHGYVSVKGDPEGVTVTATIKPFQESMMSFNRFVKQLHLVETKLSTNDVGNNG
ncbi:hypothetical protein [Salibacterium aidingense]|uniref:hypothetical protein n=1 Tax=Salibacterium aidingense TaxID=384933 RepID=UPI00041142D7|nr:hypothetical protein [Salibacterium aidingense]